MRSYVLLAFVTLVSAACSQLAPADVLQAKWNTFKVTHDKQYHSAEEKKRLTTFLENTLTIEQHNERYARGEVSYFLGHNHLSDLTEEEFRSTSLGGAPSDIRSMNLTAFRAPSSYASVPTSFDARKLGHVTEVRSQGACGSCYSFAAAAAMETNFAMKGRPLHAISEQGIMDCSNKFGTLGCNGGSAWNLLQYIKNAEGFHKLATYPYEAKLGECRFRESQSVGRATGVQLVNGEDNMLTAVGTHGALIAMIQIPREFSLYSGGVYDNPQCKVNANYHAVAIIGYGTENGKDYWLVKNSWRSTWGEQGFGKMARGKNMCGIAGAPVLPIG